MKKLLFFIVIFFYLFNFSQAEESRWVENVFNEKLLTLIKSNFEIQQLTGLDTLKVITKNLSTGSILKYKWIVGDSTYTDKEPIFTIYKPGFYDVTLIVSDSTMSDTLTKIDYLSIVLSPIENDYVMNSKLFSVPDSNYIPINIGEFNSKYYVMGYDTLTNNNNLYYNTSLFGISNDFKNSTALIENRFGLLPRGFFFNKNNDSILVVDISHYLDFFNLNNKSKIKITKFEYDQKVIRFNNEIFIQNSSYSKNMVSVLTSDFDSIDIINEYIPLTFLGYSYPNLTSFDISNNMLISLLYHPYYIVDQISPSKFVDRYYSEFIIMWMYFDKGEKKYIIKDKGILLISENYFGDDSDGERNMNNKRMRLNATKIITPKNVVHLYNNDQLFLFGKDSIYLKKINSKTFYSRSLFPYNDSLFLAGGSINGKATLFFLSTENLEIRKTITINALFGNITSIERASDGEFLLLAENKVNKEFDSFVAIKTKNLGKDAYPVSVKLGSEQQTEMNTNAGKFLKGNSLIIKYDKELSSNTILELYDLMGQKIVSTKQFQINSDTKQVICDLSQFENLIVHNTLYFYILKDPTQILYGKFMR